MTKIELVASLEGHTGAVWDVAWNPTRPIIASCSSDKSVRLYSYKLAAAKATPSSEVGVPTATFQFLTIIPSAHKRTVRSIAWSPTGKTLATGSFDSTVGIWEEVDEIAGIEGATPEVLEHTEEPREWECITALEGHESECKSVRWSSDGNLLASCSRDKSVWIWELQPDGDFECISVLMEHSQDVKALAWHPAEEILASASYDASTLLFADDPDSDWCPFQKLETRLAAHMPEANTDVERDTDDGEMVIPPLREPDTVWSAAFSPDGRYLATGGDGGGIVFWFRTGQSLDARWKEVYHVAAHRSRPCYSLAWTQPHSATECTSRLVSVGGDGTICVWRVNVPPVSVPAAATAADGANALLTVQLVAKENRAHTIYDINSVASCHRVMPEEGDQSSAARSRRQSLLQTEDLIATAGDDGMVKIWRIDE